MSDDGLVGDDDLPEDEGGDAAFGEAADDTYASAGDVAPGEDGDIYGDEDFAALSEELQAALVEFVLIDDADLAVSRLETLDFLVDMLRDLEDADDVAEWVATYGERDFHLAQERDGRLVVTDVFPVTGVLGFVPASVVGNVSLELASLDDDDVELWIETLGDFVAEWLLLAADEEKLVGHLVRTHGLTTESLADEHPALVSQHVELHEAQ